MMRRQVRLPVLMALRMAFLVLSIPLAAAEVPGAKVWETTIVIPTYLTGDPEPNPMFFFGQASQGALAPIYPYPLHDIFTGRRVDRTYKIVYLENEYLRIGILPEIGGRIFEGLDKTNNYNFFYRQHVIKPAGVSIIAAWISGGVEWNIPHHHRATTFLPVQYKVEENADGSKTVWVGELEVRHRMRWAVGYRIRPGKAYLEASLRILNRTPVVNTMLCFANVAVHVNEKYQVILPPSTQLGTGHGKHEFTRWPINDEGVDISWWKNHPSGRSVFAWNCQDDFLAGYDFSKQAGTMSIADHNIVPGKKFFEWGTGPAGRNWDANLTDSDGPYIELMVGAYSDNQPDYSWLQPYEGRSFSMNWYPFREIGGVKKANLDAAVNLDVSNGSARVGFYTTSAHPAARVSLRAGQRVLHEETVAINPGKPYTKQLPVPAGIDPHDLVASISEGGRELVSYSPVRLTPEPFPPAVMPPPAPADVKTSDELYLIGLRAQQFHDPNIDPIPYWEEALRRDPGDSRVNTVMGITAFKKAKYAEAERYLRTAIARVTDRFTTPKDAEATYYLAATLKAEGKNDEAYANFYRATWSQAWKAAAYYSLAEVAAGRAEMRAALDFVDRSIDSNALNIRAQNLKAAVLRHTGRSKQALDLLAAAAHKADPLDVRSVAERWLASKDPETAKILSSTMIAHPQAFQETASEYLNAGLWQDGADVLLQMIAAAPDKSKIHPMAYYYLGYFAERLGQASKATECYKLASSMPPDYVFPFQAEAIDVLRAAIKANARDARAHYYLGNLLYDWQPEEAIRHWEASAALDPSFAIVHRNLATAYAHRRPPELDRAIAGLEKAVSLDRKYALHFTELDELYEQVGAPVEKRLELFEKNQDVVAQRDDAQNRAIALKVAAGKYEDAVRMMSNRKFVLNEGGNLNVAEHWTNAHVLLGLQYIAARRYQQALAELRTADAIPDNLPPPEFRGRSARRTAEVAYLTGLAYEGLGDHARAVESWKQGAGELQAESRGGMMARATGIGDQAYYQALCLQKTGQAEKAKAVFQSLVDSGRLALEQPPPPERPRSGMAGEMGPLPPRLRAANAHYAVGLGYLGLGDMARAKAELARALETSPDLLGARVVLSALK